MIFKTITDETTLSGQRIVGALQARKIAQQQATAQLEIDIACLKEYQVACQNGTVTTEQFDAIMHKASASAVEYSAKVKAGTGTAQSYANAQRATNSALQEVSIGAGIASKAVKLFSTALNMIAFTAIIQGISWLIGKVDEWIVTAKEAKESADAFKQSLSTFFNETQTNLKTISSLSDRFNELSKNVDDNGKKVGGTEEEYAEFLDICQQVGQIMPELITGYTAEGEAIITLQGKVDSLTDSYREAIRTKAALFLSNGDEDGNSIKSFFEDYNDFVNGYQGVLGLKTSPSGQNTAEEFEEYYGYDKIHGWLSDVTDATLEDLEKLRAGTTEYVYLARVLKEAGYEISEISAENYNAVHDVFNNRMSVMEKGITDRVTNIRTAFQNMLYADSDYWKIDDENVISAINSLYASIDDEFIKQNELFNQTALQTFESDFVSLFNNDATKKAMVDFYTPIADDETVQNYTNRVNSALQEIQSYCNNNGIVIPIEVNNSIDTLVNSVKEKLQDDFDDKVGELTLEELHIAAEQIEVPEGTLLSWDELIAKIKEVQSSTSNIENPISFDISEYEESIDSIQSTISTLRSALDSFNQGTLDESAVIDLMQQFPALIPYIDLAADGFGNLSEGLSTLIAQQPDALIQSLQELKSSLNTDEERAQVDALIDSLQSLTSYGDSGMEAYATTIGSTWEDTANVIESVTTQFENLAKVQEAVANGLTMSTTAAAELAQIYPEILTNAEYAGNGQITLNEAVVKSILAGDESIINAQITKLEADKAELEARKETAIAELEIANQVGTAKGQIDEQTARNKIDLLNQELENEISKNNQIGQSYAQTAESMAQNTEQLGNYNAEVADNMATNMNTSSVSMADGMAVNSEASQHSLSGLAQKATDVANAVLGITTGKTISNPNAIYKGKGGTNKGGIKKVSSPGKFSSVTNDYLSGKLSLDEFKSGLEVDISSYENAISNINSQIDILKNLQATFNNTANSANGGIGGHDYANKIKDLEKEKDKINSALDDAKKGSTKETKDEYQELIDFFERRNKVLNDALSLLKTNLDNVTGSFAKNKLVDAQLGVTEEKFKNYSDALNMYTQKANEALSKLPSNIAEKIKDGAVDLTTFVGEGNKDVVEAIKDYEQWADKVADCKQELAELKTAIRQLELEKFNNIVEEFTNQFDLREDGKDLISKQIALLKEAGELIGESFFTTQIDQSKKQLELLEAEKAKLVEQMTSAVSSGRVQKGTDEWLEMANALSDVEGNILDCKKSIEEFDNELLQLHWDVFDRIQGRFKDLDSELSNLRGLFDDFKVTDGDAGWSKEGLAQLGLLAQQYELAQYQVQQYNDELNQLSSDYLAGKYSATEYADRLSELSSAQWDAVNASESIKDAIVELNEVRINEEIDAIEKEISAYKELIDAQIDALKAAKDLHDYQQQIAEKTKSITDLERQIAAMQNDDSAATVAKRKQLEEQLAEARKDLENAEYDHSIEAQEDALNKQLEDYEAKRNAEIEALRKSLEEREALIAASFETITQNADIVGQEIALIAAQHGITISDAIISSWKNGETAIASYGDVLSTGTSAFIGNIMGVENEVYNLQAQANSTADSLAWMFSTRADNLVNELASSYYSEENLNYMTQALHDSLINTLEGGYNISSITSALNSIASGLNGVASAANNAASAMAAVGAAQASAGQYSSGSGGTSGYKIVNGYNGKTVASGLTLEEAKKQWSSHYGGNAGSYHIQAYAKGTRNAKGGLRIINEEGQELTLPELKSGNYAIGNEGDQILTKKQTDNIHKWSKVSPDEYESNKDKPKLLTIEEFAAMHGVKPIDFSKLTLNTTYDVPNMARQADISPETVNRNNTVSVHYDSLVTVNGDVNDTKHFLNDMKNVANDAIKKSWHDFDLTRKYGIY